MIAKMLGPFVLAVVACNASDTDATGGTTGSSSGEASDAETTDGPVDDASTTPGTTADPAETTSADTTASADDSSTAATDTSDVTSSDASSSDTATTGESGCTVPETHPTIQAAVDDPECATIWVLPGTYVENVIVDRALTIAATDPASVTIDANAAGRAIDVTMPVSVTLVDLTLTGGDAPTGAGVRSSGDLVLQSCTVTGNSASLSGGGIHGDTTVTLIDSLVQANAIVAIGQEAQGAGVFAQTGVTLQSTDILDNTLDLDLADAPFGGAQGGGVATLGHLELTGECMIAGNALTVVGSENTGVGGGLFADTADVAAGTTIADNSIVASSDGPVAAYGAGIGVAGDATLTAVEITGNTVDASGTSVFGGGGGAWFVDGTLTLVDATVANNTVMVTTTAVQGFARGGGLVVDDAVIESSRIESNTAHGEATGQTFTEGGGVYLTGSMTVSDTTMRGNSAEAEPLLGGAAIAYGGAIAMRDMVGASLDVQRSALLDNVAIATGHTRGGAIAVEVDMPAVTTISIVSSTFSGNRSDSGFWGIGGAIALQVDFGATGELHLASSTLAFNEAGDGGGVWLQDHDAEGFARNTIVQANLAALNPDCRAVALTSFGYNIFGDDTGCTITGGPDLVGVDAELQALADNGGPTQTHALTPGTAAVDAGTPTGCTDPAGVALDVDQRGEERHVGAACDIGAFELP